jgi:hypothetical protein
MPSTLARPLSAGGIVCLGIDEALNRTQLEAAVARRSEAVTPATLRESPNTDSHSRGTRRPALRKLLR